MKKNLGKLILSFGILLLFEACNNKKTETSENKTNYYESIDHGTYVINNKGDITVLCNPMDIGKYGCSLFFGGKISKEKFSKGFFLEKSKDNEKIFDTIYSNDSKYVYFKLDNNKLIINLKTDNIGCNVLFHDSFEGYSKTSDTLELNYVNEKIQGIAIPKSSIQVKNSSAKFTENDNRPLLVLEDSKDSLKVVFRKEHHDAQYSKIVKETGKISKKDCNVLK